MSTPVANAIARMQARAAPPVDAPGRSMEESEILQMRRMLDALQAKYDALLVTNREARMAKEEELAGLRAELTTACAQRDDAERRCVEMQGRIAGMEAAPRPVDNGSKYEALVSEFSDLRVEHGACAARENGLQQLIAELRRANDTLTAQIQACLTEDESEDESEDDSEEDGGCDIEVVRGGDDRIRSLKVRYTK